MKPEKMDFAFDQVLAANRKVMTQRTAEFLRMGIGNSYGQKGKRLAVELAEEETRAKFAANRNIFQTQKAIYMLLKDYFEQKKPKEILDVFSGAAYVPFALLNSKRTQRIHLLDAHELDYGAIATALKLSRDQIDHLQFMLNPIQTRPDMLPPTEEVTLIDTGLSLPQEFRAPNVGRKSDSPSSHVPAVPLGIKMDQLTVLLKLLDTSKRVVHVVDRPYEIDVDTVASSIHERLDRVFEATQGNWQVTHFATIPEQNLASMRLGN